MESNELLVLRLAVNYSQIFALRGGGGGVLGNQPPRKARHECI